ncbi:hypothetical protein [Nostoc sp.]|uniref:hypothetical protein n=1 Tax=Nostoc sp. TaxID=1180 RepID=UPI002FF82854
MFSTIFSIIGLGNSIVAIALTTAVSVTGSINALHYSSFHLIEPHRKPVVINKF